MIAEPKGFSTFPCASSDPNDEQNDLHWFASLEDQDAALEGIARLLNAGASVDEMVPTINVFVFWQFAASCASLRGFSILSTG